MGTDVSPAGVTAYHSPAPVRQARTHYRWSFGLWSSLPRTKFRLGSNPVRNMRVPDRREGHWIEDDLIKPAALNLNQGRRCKKKSVREAVSESDREEESAREGGRACECFFFFLVDVLELISLFVLLVWAFGTQCVLSQLSQRRIKRVNLTSLSSGSKDVHSWSQQQSILNDF